MCILHEPPHRFGWLGGEGYSDTDCLVALIYRSYVDQTGSKTDEVVLVDLDNKDKTPRQLCAAAQRLATTVTHRLAG